MEDERRERAQSERHRTSGYPAACAVAADGRGGGGTRADPPFGEGMVWCPFCKTGKRRQFGHGSILPEDKEKAGSLVQMGYMFWKSTGESTTQIEDAWSMALVVVHVGAGLACATAFS